MTEIVLSASRFSWAMPIQHGSIWDKSRAMLKMGPKIMARDNYTCQGCGWRSENYQEIHHRDDDHGNFKESNLEVLCPLCHQLFHPSLASISGGGSMIWLPELTQVELNRLLFPLFAILKTGSSHPMFPMSKAIWGLLEMRKVYLENQLGKSDAVVFGQILLNMSKDEYENRSTSLRAIKMLASPSRFETEIDYWKACLDKEKTPEQWAEWARVLREPVSA